MAIMTSIRTMKFGFYYLIPFGYKRRQVNTYWLLTLTDHLLCKVCIGQHYILILLGAHFSQDIIYFQITALKLTTLSSV